MKFSHSHLYLTLFLSLGLTACGSGGGSNNAPTTAHNASEQTITVPNSEQSAGSTQNTNQPNVNTATTKVDTGGLTGKAIYSGTMDYSNSGIRSRAKDNWIFSRGGVVKLEADFDKQTVAGSATLDTRSGRSGNYRQIKNGANLTFEETSLYRDSDGDLAFKGQATGVVSDVLDATYIGAAAPFDVKGTYEGYFKGSNAEEVHGVFDVSSPKDSRVGATGRFSGNRE